MQEPWQLPTKDEKEKREDMKTDIKKRPDQGVGGKPANSQETDNLPEMMECLSRSTGIYRFVERIYVIDHYLEKLEREIGSLRNPLCEALDGGRAIDF